MNKLFHPTLYNGYDYLSIVVLKSLLLVKEADRPPVILWEYDCRGVLRITNANIRCALMVPCDCSHM